MNPSRNTSEYYFFFPESHAYYSLDLTNAIPERFVIGFAGNSPQFSTLSVYNFTLYNYSGSSDFQTLNLGNFNNVLGANYSINTNQLNYIDFVTSTFSNRNYSVSKGIALSDAHIQPEPTDFSVALNTSSGEWGILMLAQTYSPLWILDATSSYSQHLIVNVGLNGWLVNTTGILKGNIIYSAQKYLDLGINLEVVLLPAWAVLSMAVVYRRRLIWWRK